MTQNARKPQSQPSNDDGSWNVRHPGLCMEGGTNKVYEFTGMWPLKPDADLVALTKALAPGGWINPAGESFARMTTLLGLIRGARWFVANTEEFGPTLFFITQFDHSLQKYFDDFVLNGKDNLEAVWGHCIGCPTGPDVGARDIVQYIASGQIKTLAVFDAYPGLSHGQTHKIADWYEKTQKFQRAVSAGGGSLEDKVDAFMKELAQPYKFATSAAAIDTDVGSEWQYTDVAERLGVNKKAA